MSETVPDDPPDTPDDTDAPAPQAPADAIRALGFDPALVQAVVVTATTAVAVSVDYPEPYVQPEEGTDDSE